MHGFVMVIGKCVISPASPKAALALLLWLYGMGGPGVSYEDYKQEYVAVGGERVEFVEQCFADWPMHEERK